MYNLRRGVLGKAWQVGAGQRALLHRSEFREDHWELLWLRAGLRGVNTQLNVCRVLIKKECMRVCVGEGGVCVCVCMLIDT